MLNVVEVRDDAGKWVRHLVPPTWATPGQPNELHVFGTQPGGEDACWCSAYHTPDGWVHRDAQQRVQH